MNWAGTVQLQRRLLGHDLACPESGIFPPSAQLIPPTHNQTGLLFLLHLAEDVSSAHLSRGLRGPCRLPGFVEPMSWTRSGLRGCILSPIPLAHHAVLLALRQGSLMAKTPSDCVAQPHHVQSSSVLERVVGTGNGSLRLRP